MKVRNRVEVMHGVNLDQLGRRDPAHYGTLTLTDLEMRIEGYARELGLTTRFFHTNSEEEFVEHLHRLEDISDGIVMNPGAWTHYSYAIRDALEIAALRVSGQEELRAQVEDLLRTANLPTRLDDGLDPDAIVAATARDKKRVGAEVPFVLVHAPGDVRHGERVEPDAVRAAVAELAA